MKPENRAFALVLGINVVVYIVFLSYIFYAPTVFFDFLTAWSAGILGILTAFAIDRTIERSKDDKITKDFLALMRNELTEIKGKIPPQTTVPLMLYPEVWDSFVSSGLVRLLSSVQVARLSSVYRFVKGFQYEAEWVRRIVEEHESIPDIEREKKQCVAKRYNILLGNYVRSGEQLSKEIEKVLNEDWWS